MAKPLDPNSARSLVTAPPADAPEKPAGQSVPPPPEPAANGSPPAKRTFKPWPTTDAPLSPANGDGFASILPAEDWEEPDGPLVSSYAGSAQNGYPLGVDGWGGTNPAQDQETGMDLADSSPLFPGRRPLYKRSEPPPTPGEQLAGVIDFLQNLQKSIRRATPEAGEASPAALGSTLLQLRRLTRTGVVPDHFEIGVLPKPPRVQTPAPVETAPAPVVPATPATVESGEILPPPERVGLKRRHAVWLVLTGGLCLVTLALVAYLWTRVGSLPRAANPLPRRQTAQSTPGPAPEREVSEEALALASLALEEMQRGDLKKASEILAKAQKQGIFLPGLNYQAALLAFNQGRGQEADDFIERSIQANESVSDCWYLRANSVFFTEGPAQAAEAFEQAVAADPFHPRSYFFRAECLRRNGKAAAAVAQFQQALRCRPNSTDTELILFKIGLTKLETNTDLIFKTELHDRLAQEPVLGDTLLLAAADAISRNEFAEAAEFLKRAALVLPVRVFQSRTRDYVYRSQANQPDIAAVLKLTMSAAAPSGPPAPRPGRMLIDPATRSLAEADPGGW